MLHISINKFEELSIEELYSILRLRSEVFVVEQNCVYQDLDEKDQKSFHVIGFKGGRVVAYTRIFKPGDYFKEASIGRVAVKISERKHGYGRDIMIASIRAVEELFNENTIHLSAQLYLKKFYTSLGFEQVGEGYLEGRYTTYWYGQTIKKTVKLTVFDLYFLRNYYILMGVLLVRLISSSMVSVNL